jgi:hypothetical protein
VGKNKNEKTVKKTGNLNGSASLSKFSKDQIMSITLGVCCK